MCNNLPLDPVLNSFDFEVFRERVNLVADNNQPMLVLSDPLEYFRNLTAFKV